MTALPVGRFGLIAFLNGRVRLTPGPTNQSRSVLRAAHRELPAERIRGVHDRILRRVQTPIERER